MDTLQDLIILGNFEGTSVPRPPPAENQVSPFILLLTGHALAVPWVTLRNTLENYFGTRISNNNTLVLPPTRIHSGWDGLASILAAFARVDFSGPDSPDNTTHNQDEAKVWLAALRIATLQTSFEHEIKSVFLPGKFRKVLQTLQVPVSEVEISHYLPSTKETSTPRPSLGDRLSEKSTSIGSTRSSISSFSLVSVASITSVATPPVCNEWGALSINNSENRTQSRQQKEKDRCSPNVLSAVSPNCSTPQEDTKKSLNDRSTYNLQPYHSQTWNRYSGPTGTACTSQLSSFPDISDPQDAFDSSDDEDRSPDSLYTNSTPKGVANRNFTPPPSRSLRPSGSRGLFPWSRPRPGAVSLVNVAPDKDAWIEKEPTDDDNDEYTEEPIHSSGKKRKVISATAKRKEPAPTPTPLSRSHSRTSGILSKSIFGIEVEVDQPQQPPRKKQAKHTRKSSRAYLPADEKPALQKRSRTTPPSVKPNSRVWRLSENATDDESDDESGQYHIPVSHKRKMPVQRMKAEHTPSTTPNMPQTGRLLTQTPSIPLFGRAASPSPYSSSYEPGILGAAPITAAPASTIKTKPTLVEKLSELTGMTIEQCEESLRDVSRPAETPNSPAFQRDATPHSKPTQFSTPHFLEESRGKNKDSKPIVASKERPPHSYSALIGQAILSTPDKRIRLADIYEFISTRYPYYSVSEKGWQNSIRHNLSLQSVFVKLHDRYPPGHDHTSSKGSNTKKGCMWSIAPGEEWRFVGGGWIKDRLAASVLREVGGLEGDK